MTPTIDADLISTLRTLKLGRLLDTLDDWAAEVQEVTADWDTTRERGLEPAVRAMLERLVDDARRRTGDAGGVDRPVR